MTPTTLKVAERLAYENLLMVQGIIPRRRRIALGDFLSAAREEPRFSEVLPAILLHKPTIFSGIHKDLKRDPRWMRRVSRNLTAKECRLAEVTYRSYLRQKRSRNKTRLFNLRMSEEDWTRLTALSQKLGTDNHSEIIRRLIKEKLAELGVGWGGA